MSENEPVTINQTGNIGDTVAYHTGDNVTYVNENGELTPKHAMLRKHEDFKEAWAGSETCEWLLREAEFKTWKNMERGCSLFWLYGRPGCGKSTLMSRVIDSIQPVRPPANTNSDPRLLYFYVPFGAEEKSDRVYHDMLKTFWEQAIRGPEKRAVDHFGRRSSIEHVEKELHELLAVSQKEDIFIVIDALDQLPHQSHYRLFSGLNTMIQKLYAKKSDRRLRLAISSRDCNGIDKLRGYELSTIEVTPERTQDAIKLYLHMNLKSTLFEEHPELRERTHDELLKQANGMFLLVHLQVLRICAMEMQSQVEHALKDVARIQKLQDFYEDHAKGFECLKDSIRKQIAQRTLALLAHNSGSMAKEAIFIALSLNLKGEIDQMLHKDLTANPTNVVRFCNNLVVIDDGLGIFRFSHTTVLEFFRVYELPTYNRRLAELCLSHLCSSDFSRGPWNGVTWYNTGRLEPILQKHPFLSFASSRWATSIKTSSESESSTQIQQSHSQIIGLLKILFNKDETQRRKGNIQLAFQVHLLRQGKAMPDGISHEHIISYFALDKFIHVFMERGWLDPTKRDDDGLSSLHWAIRNELDHDAAALTARKLIQHYADKLVSSVDKDGRSPLHYAAYYGNAQAAQVLINDRNVRLNLTDKNNETALITACRKHHEDVIMCLINSKADVKVQSAFGSALQALCLIGCCRCAEAILNRFGKSKIIEEEGPFGTSLHAAAFHGHPELVRLLCSKQIDLRATHKTYGSAVTAAAIGNLGVDPTDYEEIVRELLDRGVNANDRSGLVGPALRAAAYQGSPEIVRLLLAKGAKVRKAKGPMGTAYEAADDRGHEVIKAMLIESDPKAPHYGKASASRSHDHRQIQRKIFRATLKANNMDTINSLIDQFEKLIGKEIRTGDTTFLKVLSSLGKDCFHDVVALATQSRESSEAPTSYSTRRRLRLRDLLKLCGIRSVEQEDDPVLQARPIGATSPNLRRAGSALVQDGLGEHFPQVLDRMTQAAVKILEEAIATNDRAVIRLISSTWIEALNNLISYPAFGEPMLQMVVLQRANELKEHLTNNHLDPQERFARAEALALVGIELLLTAVQRGHKYRYLCFVISKLWIKAVSDVEDLGEAGEVPVQQLIRVFAERFSKAVMVQDQVNAEVYAQAGLELLRAAALSSRKELLRKFSREWVVRWDEVLNGKMQSMARQLVDRKWREYQECVKDKKHDEALGFALIGIGLLRAAIELGSSSTTSTLRKLLETGLQSAQEVYPYRESTAGDEAVRGVHTRAQDLVAIFDATVDLFGTAEEIQPGALNSLAEKVLELGNIASHDDLGIVKKAVYQRIGEADPAIDPHEQKQGMIGVSRAILLFLDIALCSETRNHTLLVALKKMALKSLGGEVSDLVERSDFARYRSAIVYLR